MVHDLLRWMSRKFGDDALTHTHTHDCMMHDTWWCLVVFTWRENLSDLIWSHTQKPILAHTQIHCTFLLVRWFLCFNHTWGISKILIHCTWLSFLSSSPFKRRTHRLNVNGFLSFLHYLNNNKIISIHIQKGFRLIDSYTYCLPAFVYNYKEGINISTIIKWIELKSIWTLFFVFLSDNLAWASFVDFFLFNRIRPMIEI